MQRRVGFFAADVRDANNELGLARSKPVTSPLAVDDASRRHADNQRHLDDVENQVYQRIVAKLGYLTHDRLDLRYATSCLACAASAPDLGDMQAARRVAGCLWKVPLAWQGSVSCDPRLGVLLCYAGSFITMKTPWVLVLRTGLCLSWTIATLEENSAMRSVLNSRAGLSLMARVDVTCPRFVASLTL